MQIFINFTTDDIIATANIKESNLKKYLMVLVRHGYIEETGRTGKAGQLHCRKLYELVKDTGPNCPVAVRGGGLSDLNTGEILEPVEVAA